MRQRSWQMGRGVVSAMVVAVVVLMFVVPLTRNWTMRAGNAVGSAATRLGQVLRRGDVVPRVEDENLRAMNEALTREVTELRAVVSASKSLERIEGFLSESRRAGLSAAVVGYSDDPGVSTFTVGAGSVSGVVEGQAVVTDGGMLVGKVIQVRERVAVVRTIRDTQSSVLARVGNQSSSQGVVQGQRAIAMRMSFIPIDDRVDVGQVVETSGSEDLVPPGLAIGTISSLETRPGDVFQTVSVFSPIRISELSAVAILRGIQ